MASFTHNELNPQRNAFLCRIEEEGYDRAQILTFKELFFANLTALQAEHLADKRMSVSQIRQGFAAICGGYYSPLTHNYSVYQGLDAKKHDPAKVKLWYRPDLSPTQMDYFLLNKDLTVEEINTQITLFLLEN